MRRTQGFVAAVCGAVLSACATQASPVQVVAPRVPATVSVHATGSGGGAAPAVTVAGVPVPSVPPVSGPPGASAAVSSVPGAVGASGSAGGSPVTTAGTPAAAPGAGVPGATTPVPAAAAPVPARAPDTVTPSPTPAVAPVTPPTAAPPASSPAAPPVVAPAPVQDAASPPVPLPVAAPAAAPSTADRLRARPCRVALLADSVGHDLMRNGLAGALGAQGCPIVWSRVVRGSPLADGVAALTAAGGTSADVIVVLQGYSSARSRQAQFPGLLEQVLRLAGSRTVVWTLYGRTLDCSAGYQQTLAQFNQWLRAAAVRAPNLRLVDYPSLIAAHPEYSQHRCPHLLDSGSRAVASWMAVQVRRLVDTR